MLRNALFTFALVSLSSPLLAADLQCSPVDLRNDPRLPPVRTQGDTNWCYVVVATDLLSFHFSRNLSYLDLAISFNDGKRQIDFGPGNIEKVLVYAKHHGVCDEADFPSQSASFSIYHLREQLEKVEQIDSVPNNSCEISDDITLAKTIFPEESADQLSHAQARRSSAAHFIQILEQSSCPHRPLGKSFSYEFPKNTPNPREILKVVNRQMTRGEPIAIGYDVGMIRDGKKGEHSSLLIGRRWNSQTQECEFLLRNSGGTLCQNADGTTYYRAGLDCEDGNIWIPESQLARYADDFVFIR